MTNKRIFMLGNGASLLHEPNLWRLKDEATFGCNYLLHWEGFPFLPTYYGNGDLMRDLLSTHTYEGKSMKRFAVARDRTLVDKYPEWEFVQMSPDIGENRIMYGGFVMDDRPLHTGQTGPLTLAQVAWRLGYREFYFLGIEHEGGYCYPVKDGMVNHKQIHPRIMHRIRENFRRAKADVEAAGGKMVDCTRGGLMNDILGFEPLEGVLRVLAA